MFRFRGWPVAPPSNNVCWELRPHCAQSGGLEGARSCAPALTDRKASNPARRHALARTFRFERTRFMVYHLVLKYLQLGPGPGERFQRALLPPTANKGCTVLRCAAFLVFRMLNCLCAAN